MADNAYGVPPADDQWIVQIQKTMGCVYKDEVKTYSICRVPEKFREAEDKGCRYYRPQLVAMGPFHRGTSSDLQIMEERKWLYMHQLLRRPTQNELKLKTVTSCCKAVKKIESIIRESYVGKIEMESEELARVMLLDACFFLELLLKLSNPHADPPMDDRKKMLRVLTDLALLENQIPFAVLTILSNKILSLAWAHAQEQAQDQAQHEELAGLLALSQNKKLSPERVASLFKCNVANFDLDRGVYHFLHLMHLCSPDPYNERETREVPLELKRRARKLHAFGITITAIDPAGTPVVFIAGNTNEGNVAADGANIAGNTNEGNAADGANMAGNNNEGKAAAGSDTVAAALEQFGDNFNFKIDYDPKKRELIIPTLHIKEATEVKWRNFIAWEQGGLTGIGYKFTSYAHFFRGLASSVHDIQLLKQKGVLKAYEGAKDDDLLIMFKSITTGAELMDGRYRKVCKKLNEVDVNDYCVLTLRMVCHYWLRFWRWLGHGFISLLVSFIKSSLASFKDIYLSSLWKFIGVVAGTALLALTITQTVYTIRGPGR